MPYAPFRLIPRSIRPRLLMHIFMRSEEKRLHLFDRAPLDFCPGMHMKLFPTDISHRHIAYTGFYELELSRLMAKLAIEPGGLLVDVGANYGYFTLLWAGLKRANRVISVEASPRVFPSLKENIEMNGITNQVDIHNVAAGERAGSVSKSRTCTTVRSRIAWAIGLCRLGRRGYTSLNTASVAAVTV